MARTSYFAGDVFLDDLYTTYGTAPTTDKGLQDNLVKLLGVRAKLYAGLNKGEIDRELRTLSEQAKLYKVTQETAADLAETRGKSSRVTSQNIAKMKSTLIDGQVALSKAMNARAVPYTTALNAAAAAGLQGQAAYPAMMTNLSGWKDSFGKPLAPDSADNVSVMNQMSITATGKPLNQVSVDQLVTALGPAVAGGQVGDYARTNFTAAKMRFEDMLAKDQLLTDDLKYLNQNGSALSNLAAGAPGSAEQMARLRSISANVQSSLMSAFGRSAADIEAQRELTVNNNAELTKLDEDIDIARQRAYGTQKTTADEKIGRLMATPQFKAWADGNGYKIGDYNIDESGQLSMAPGQDDKAALRVFLYQAKRTDQKYGPLLASKSTGVLVRVTAQDPEQRAQVMDKYKSTDGSYYLNVDNELVKPSDARQELERGGFIPSVEASRAGYFRLPNGTVLDMEGNPAQAPADAVFVPAYKNDASGKPERYLTPGDVSSPERVRALTEPPALGAPDKMDLLEGPAEKAALDAVAKGAPYKVADDATVQSAWTGVYTGYLDRPHARDALGGKTGMSAISLDGGKIRISGDRPATIEVVKARDPGIVAGVVRAYNKLMPEQHLEKLRTEGVGVDREDGMPISERVQLGEEAYDRFTAEPPGALRAPTDAVMTMTAPSGKVLDVTLPIKSQAVKAGMSEGRDLIPVGGDTQTPTAPAATAPAAPATTTSASAAPAPATAPATKPAPGAAPSTAKTLRVTDKEGNVFDVSLEKIKLVSQPEGAKKSKKTEWSSSDPAFEKIMVQLEKDNPLEAATTTKAETKPAPSALPKAGSKVDVKAPAETGPEIGSRQAAAVIVPRKVPKTELDLEEEKPAFRKAVDARREALRVALEKGARGTEAKYVEKPIEAGEFMPGQTTGPLPGLLAPSRLPAMLSVLDSADLKEGRSGMTDAEIAQLRALRDRYMKAQSLVSPVDQKAPMARPDQVDAARTDKLKAQRLALGEMESEINDILEGAEQRKMQGVGDNRREMETALQQAQYPRREYERAREEGIRKGVETITRNQERRFAEAKPPPPPKPMFDKAPTPEEAELQAVETISSNQERRFAPPVKSFDNWRKILGKRAVGALPVPPELDNME